MVFFTLLLSHFVYQSFTNPLSFVRHNREDKHMINPMCQHPLSCSLSIFFYFSLICITFVLKFYNYSRFKNMKFICFWSVINVYDFHLVLFSPMSAKETWKKHDQCNSLWLIVFWKTNLQKMFSSQISFVFKDISKFTASISCHNDWKEVLGFKTLINFL